MQDVLPHSHFKAMAGIMSLTEWRITLWSDAVQRLLNNHAQAKDIAKGVEDLRDTEQKPKEDEEMFFRPMKDAFNRCDNVFPLDTMINM